MPVSDPLSDYEAFREASDWDDAVRYSDGNLPDLPPAEILQQYGDAQRNKQRRARMGWGWGVLVGIAIAVLILATVVGPIIVRLISKGSLLG